MAKKLNNKEVRVTVQKDILEYFEATEYEVSTNLEALKKQIDYMKYNNEKVYETAKRLVEGGTFLVSYYEVGEYLRMLGCVVCKEDSDNWFRYVGLIAQNVVLLLKIK